jgi:hypothetical protein
MQRLSFAQVHLQSRNDAAAQIRTGKCDLNARLFGRLNRMIGYIDLGGENEHSGILMRSTVDHGALPTVTIQSAQEILQPNSHVAHMLDLAR